MTTPIPVQTEQYAQSVGASTLLLANSKKAAAAIRALTDEELDRAAPVSLNSDAPLTCQFFLEDHAVRHSYHHLAGSKQRSGVAVDMKHLGISVEIQAHPAQVWEVIWDMEHWFEWAPTINSIQILDPGYIGVGTRALVRQPRLLPASWQITEVDEGPGFAWTTRAPGLRVTARHSVNGSASRSRATLSVDFYEPFGALCALLTRGINARYLALEAQGLKARAEAKGASR